MKILQALVLLLALVLAAPASAGFLDEFEKIKVFGGNAAFGEYLYNETMIQGPTFTDILKENGYDVTNHSRIGNWPIQGRSREDGSWMNGWIDWRRGAQPTYYFLNNKSMLMDGPNDLAIVLFGSTTHVSAETFKRDLLIFIIKIYQMGAEKVLLMTPPPFLDHGVWDEGVEGNAHAVRELWEYEFIEEGPDLYLEMKSCLPCWFRLSGSGSYYKAIDARGHALIGDLLLGVGE